MSSTHALRSPPISHHAEVAPAQKRSQMLVALGIIALIGALVAAGCLFTHIGYASIAVGAAGIAISALFFLAAKCSRYQAIETSSGSETISTPSNILLAQKQTAFKENFIDIEKEAHRFFFKKHEQSIATAITCLVDATVHQHMTESSAPSTLVDHIENLGFSFLNEQILEHPELDGWIMKGGGKRRWSWIGNDLGISSPNSYDNILRVFMAEKMSKAIKEDNLDFLIPEKRLLLSPFAIPNCSLHEKYYVFSKKMDILSPDDTCEALRQLSKEQQTKLAKALCKLIIKTGYMDVHFGNLRWCTKFQKVAIIDTESQGLLLEKHDLDPFQPPQTIKTCALIGLQEMKDKMGRDLPIFALEATRAIKELQA